MNNENPIQGMMRVWGTDIQVFNGSSWTDINASYATITLDTNSLDLLNWAKKKKMEEEVLISLPSDNPAVKIARANVNRAKQELVKAEEQLKITEVLSRDETTS
jgi:AAA+ superfamily predicted ATPase